MHRNSTVLLTLSLLASLILTLAAAHDASTYTINIRASGPEPISAEGVVIGDAVQWINFDSSNNTTHRIVFDADGDGLYNGTGEWDSGQLLAWTVEGTCMDDTGNKTEGCAVSFTWNVTSAEYVGTHVYQDMTYVDGNLSGSVNGTLVVALDSHAGDAPCVGDGCEDDEQTGSGVSEGGEGERWLLALAVVAGAAAVLLGLKMMFSSPRRPQDKWFEQE